MAKSVFLLHPRQSFREDLAWAGQEMADMSEKSLEELCNLLPPQVTPVSRRGGDSETIGWFAGNICAAQVYLRGFWGQGGMEPEYKGHNNSLGAILGGCKL